MWSIVPGAYTYTPDIWPPLAAAVFLAALSLYSWRRRDVPSALWLATGSGLGVMWLLSIALEAAAVAPATKIAWHKFQAVLQLPAATTTTCFALEYTFPGRWLTRRNLTLLSIPSLVTTLTIALGDSRWVWRRLEIGPDGAVVAYSATPGAIITAFGMGLVLINTAAFLWLFVRSPQHRWPAALMLFGEIAGRGLYLLDITKAPVPQGFDPVIAGILITWTAYAIALFGFHILDPLPAARTMALEQMRDGMMAFDGRWRIVSLNPAAASMLSISESRALGKTTAEALPALPALSAVLVDATDPIEIGLGVGPAERRYTLDLSSLRDFRGLSVGYLLLLRDVTEQRRAQARILEQQRTLAAVQERERLARELHDGVAQELAAIHLQAGTTKLLLTQGEIAQASDYLDNLAGATLQAQANVRDYLLGAKAVISAEHPFFPTLREYLLQFSRQYGLPVELTTPPGLEDAGLPQAVEAQLLRIIQEALSNVRKHARARSAQVVFSLDGPQAQVAIIDNGCGFDPTAVAAQSDGYGLRSMRERAEAIGGSLEITSSPGQGTRVVARAPLVQ
jgi:signal transduction histidine kinase